jgi:hypothetical protein
VITLDDTRFSQLRHVCCCFALSNPDLPVASKGMALSLVSYGNSTTSRTNSSKHQQQAAAVVIAFYKADSDTACLLPTPTDVCLPVRLICNLNKSVGYSFAATLLCLFSCAARICDT